MSQILSGDTSELRKRAKAIEHDREAPSKEHLAVLREYGTKAPEEQQVIRNFSGKAVTQALSLDTDCLRRDGTEFDSISGSFKRSQAP